MNKSIDSNNGKSKRTSAAATQPKPRKGRSVNKPKTSPAPTISKTKEQPSSDEAIPTESGRGHRKGDPKWTDEWSVYLAGGALVAAIIGVVLLYFELTALRKTNTLIRENAAKELGASLSVEPGIISPQGVIVEKIPYRLVNSGRTPANSVSHAAFRLFRANPIEAAKWIWEFPKKSKSRFNFGFIPAGGERPATASVLEMDSPLNVSDLPKEGVRLYFVGRVYFTNTFKQDCHVDFCMWWLEPDFSPRARVYCYEGEGPNDHQCAKAKEKGAFSPITAPITGIIAPVTGVK